MSKQTTDPKTKLAELATERASLSSKTDKAARFRCRMIAGRAQSLIRKTVKTAVAQDEAFEAWQKVATAMPEESKPKSGKGKGDASTGNALIN